MFNLGIIYRHPNGNVNDFISALNENFLQNNQTQKYYICGDLNIDVNSRSCCINASTYAQMVACNKANSLIDKPTRITNTLQTAQSWTALFRAFSSHRQPSASLTKLFPSWTRLLAELDKP